MYADDTQIFSSSYDTNELVIKLNSDLANVRDRLIENKLQMHPSKSKLMFIGSSYNLNNKNTEQPVVVNNTPVSRTDTHKCLGVFFILLLSLFIYLLQYSTVEYNTLLTILHYISLAANYIQYLRYLPYFPYIISLFPFFFFFFFV